MVTQSISGVASLLPTFPSSDFSVDHLAMTEADFQNCTEMFVRDAQREQSAENMLNSACSRDLFAKLPVELVEYTSMHQILQSYK